MFAISSPDEFLFYFAAFTSVQKLHVNPRPKSRTGLGLIIKPRKDYLEGEGLDH